MQVCVLDKRRRGRKRICRWFGELRINIGLESHALHLDAPSFA